MSSHSKDVFGRLAGERYRYQIAKPAFRESQTTNDILIVAFVRNLPLLVLLHFNKPKRLTYSYTHHTTALSDGLLDLKEAQNAELNLQGLSGIEGDFRAIRSSLTTNNPRNSWGCGKEHMNFSDLAIVMSVVSRCLKNKFGRGLVPDPQLTKDLLKAMFVRNFKVLAVMHLTKDNGRVYTHTHLTTPVPSGSISLGEAQQDSTLDGIPPANLSFEGDHHLISTGTDTPEENPRGR
jgi:hypothetical protein